MCCVDRIDLTLFSSYKKQTDKCVTVMNRNFFIFKHCIVILVKTSLCCPHQVMNPKFKQLDLGCKAYDWLLCFFFSCCFSLWDKLREVMTVCEFRINYRGSKATEKQIINRAYETFFDRWEQR